MKVTLAKSLVANIMDWTDERATKEFAWLDLMVNYKFDRYQQYGPGYRFYVHLLRWLSQFDAPDREQAWELLRNRLVYMSQDEMHHLITLTGPTIERAMRCAIAKRRGIPLYRIDSDTAATRELEEMRCRTLYVGVSDGARIDVFRRYNEGRISNEQVVPMIEISATKKAALKEKLQERLTAMGSAASATFEWVCLIDDFTGSGYTSIRQDAETGAWDGKVHRFMKESAAGNGDPLLSKDAHVLVHHYLASHAASTTVSSLLPGYAGQHPGLSFLASFTYVLPSSIVVSAELTPELAQLLLRHYDPSVENTHTKKGIALGYKNGGLPLVLEHNTPNNSLATLWARSNPTKENFDANHRMCPLFPRRQRHSDVRP